MQWPLRPAAVEGAAQGLAVNGHDLPVEGLGKGLSPGAEAGLEGVRVDQHEDAPEGVVRGNAVSQAQERPQPAQLVTAIERDVVPALGTGDHSAHRDHQDIDQPMINLAGTPRILKRRNVLDQLLNRHRRPPFVDEGRTVTPRYTVKSHQPISCVAPGVKAIRSSGESGRRGSVWWRDMEYLGSTRITPGQTHEGLRSYGWGTFGEVTG